MDAAELALWSEANAALPATSQARRPCEDCPASWARERRAEGECNGNAGESRAGAAPIHPYHHP
jgi:hypothetical protein